MSAPGPRPPMPFGIFPNVAMAMVLVMAAFSAQLFIAVLVSGGDFDYAAVAVGQALGIGGVATLAARFVAEPQVERLGLRGFDLRFLLPLLMVIPIVILVSEIDNYVRPLFPGELIPEADEPIPPPSELSKTYERILLTLIGVGIQPVVNSFLIMGVVQQGVIAHVGRLWGIAFTTLIYWVMNPPAASSVGEMISYSVYVLATGALLCIARLATGSLLAPILLAAGLAIINMVALFEAEFVQIPGFNAEGDHTPAVVLIPCAASVAAGAWMLVRAAAAAPDPPPPPPPDEDDEPFPF